jgi:hypothetical protein
MNNEEIAMSDLYRRSAWQFYVLGQLGTRDIAKALKIDECVVEDWKREGNWITERRMIKEERLLTQQDQIVEEVLNQGPKFQGWYNGVFEKAQELIPAMIEKCKGDATAENVGNVYKVLGEVYKIGSMAHGIDIAKAGLEERIRNKGTGVTYERMNHIGGVMAKEWSKGELEMRERAKKAYDELPEDVKNHDITKEGTT